MLLHGGAKQIWRRIDATTAAVIAALIMHLALASVIAVQYSPTPDEMPHIAGGLAIWQQRRFDMYSVNPPLPRMVAALPAYLSQPVPGWTASWDYDPTDRPEFLAGTRLAQSDPDRWRWFLIGGRLMLIPFSALGGVVCYLWAKQAYGSKAGLFSLVLWCFSPTLLTWDTLIGSDGLAASFGICAAYGFRNWLKEPCWPSAFLAGVSLGLALLSKFTLILFIPLWVILWAIFYQTGPQGGNSRSGRPRELAAILLLAVDLVNVGYLFTGSFTPLGAYRFVSLTLSGSSSDTSRAGVANRFAHPPLEHIPVPLPVDFVKGIDIQRKDLEGGKRSYLLGRWKERGWWYYYLVALATKAPAGAMCLGVIAIAMQVTGRARRNKEGSAPVPALGPHAADREPRVDGILLTVVPLVLLGFVSSQTGFSIHFRYVLPAVPFMIIWTSQAAGLIARGRFACSALVLGLLAWSVASSVRAFPYTMSHFNELARGRRNGGQVLLGSSFSWGQNCFYLRDWIDRSRLSSVPFVNVSSGLPLELLGIKSRGSSPPFTGAASDTDLCGPVPGWHLVDIEAILDPSSGLGYFSEIKPDAVIAGTIAAYHLGRDGANEVRLRLGLKPLPSPTCSLEEFRHRLSRDVRREMTPRIAFFSMRSSREDRDDVPNELRACFPRAEWKVIDSEMICSGVLNNCDLLFIPGGRSSEQSAALGDKGRRAVSNYIENGGGYVGLCAGAFLGSSGFDWSLSLLNVACREGTHYVPGHGERSWLDRGGGGVQLVLSEGGTELFGPTSTPLEADFTGGPIFLPGRRTFMPDYVVLAEYRSEVCRFPFQRGTMVGTPAILAAPHGRGKVFLIGAHLETSAGSRDIVRKIITAAAR